MNEHEYTCKGCGQTMDQSDVCRHDCGNNAPDYEAIIKELRAKVEQCEHGQRISSDPSKWSHQAQILAQAHRAEEAEGLVARYKKAVTRELQKDMAKVLGNLTDLEIAEAEALRLRAALTVASQRLDTLSRWRKMGYDPAEMEKACRSAAADARNALICTACGVPLVVRPDGTCRQCGGHPVPLLDEEGA